MLAQLVTLFFLNWWTDKAPKEKKKASIKKNLIARNGLNTKYVFLREDAKITHHCLFENAVP